MRLAEKQQIVSDLHEKLAKSQIVVLTDYKGLGVEAVNKLRRALGAENVDYQVVKNTLLRRAAEDTDAAVLMDQFKGPSAIAISYDDPVAPAKVLTKFAEENNKFEIRSAVMGGKIISVDGIKALSSLPSREVLLSQLLSAMNGVPTSFVRVLNGVPQSFLNVLQAIKDQKENAA